MADFDHDALEQHNVTAWDIENVRRYVTILQGTDSRTYADIAGGCYYGTSALLHEVVEVRILLERDRQLLTRSRQEVKAFLQDNEDAHVQGLITEYLYLHQVIKERLREEIGLEALVRANTTLFDYERLLASEIPHPFFKPSWAEVVRARELLSGLKEEVCHVKPI